MAWKDKKDEGERNNRKPLVYTHMQLTWDGEIRGKPLVEMAPDVEWCDLTIEWWDMWRSSEMAMVMQPSDWFALLETAFLHNRLFGVTMKYDKALDEMVPSGPSNSEATTLVGEIRRRSEQYGATFMDRKKYGIKIGADSREEDAVIEKEAKKTVDYLERLNAAAAKQREE